MDETKTNPDAILGELLRVLGSEKARKLIDAVTDLAFGAVEKQLHQHIPRFLWPLLGAALGAADDAVDAAIFRAIEAAGHEKLAQAIGDEKADLFRFDLVPAGK